MSSFGLLLVVYQLYCILDVSEAHMASALEIFGKDGRHMMLPREIQPGSHGASNILPRLAIHQPVLAFFLYEI